MSRKRRFVGTLTLRDGVFKVVSSAGLVISKGKTLDVAATKARNKGYFVFVFDDKTSVWHRPPGAIHETPSSYFLPPHARHKRARRS